MRLNQSQWVAIMTNFSADIHSKLELTYLVQENQEFTLINLFTSPCTYPTKLSINN